jgi:DNA invertase Pin-like site-specific DNA recombinase
MARKTAGNTGENVASKGRALAYLRTSSQTNAEGDSGPRQRREIMAYAAHAGLTVEREFYDADVSGADMLDQREGFTAMLSFARENGIGTIIVENATRFARDLIVQETGYAMLKAEGITLIAADSPHTFTSDTPTATLIRQILGAVSQFEKAMLVAKLRGARDRASAAQGGKRIEGRKGYADTEPQLIREAKRLARKNPKTGKTRSLREIAADLSDLGHTTASGKAFSASQVQRLLGNS